MNPKLDFSQINSQRVTILVNDAANARAMAAVLIEQNFMVEIAVDPSQMYTRLCENGAPGLVLISSQCASPMAKMMPDFLCKRFKVPIIYFQETESVPAPDLARKVFPPEIWSVGLISAAEMVDAIKNFASSYEDRLRTQLHGPKVNPVAHSSMIVAPDKTEDVERPTEAPPSSEALLREVKEACVPHDVKIGEKDVVALHACRVADPSGKGYFVFAFPVRSDQEDFAGTLTRLEEKIRSTAGSDVSVEHLDQAVPGTFLTDLMQRSDEVVTGMIEDHEMILLYFRNRGDVEEPQTRIVDENFLVPMEEWWMHLPLPCHTYVWMALNHRRILYVRPGDRLRPEAFERLHKNGVAHLAVDPADFSDYRKIREMVHIARAVAGVD